jgi:hypothetical protein
MMVYAWVALHPVGKEFAYLFKEENEVGIKKTLWDEYILRSLLYNPILVGMLARDLSPTKRGLILFW